MSERVQFPPNVTFGCRALDGPVWRETELFQASPTLSVHPHPPVELDDVWYRWLGSIQAEKFRTSNFVIVAIRRNELGCQNLDSVEQEVLAYQYALLLEGYGYCDGGVQVCGNTHHDLHVGPVSTVLRHQAVRGRRLLHPTKEVLVKAAQVSASLLTLYRYPVRFLRLRRGLAWWVRGIQEPNPEPTPASLRSCD